MTCKHISVVNGKGNIIRKLEFKLHSLHFSMLFDQKKVVNVPNDRYIWSIKHVKTTHGLISTNRWLLNCALYLLIYRVAISNRLFFLLKNASGDNTPYDYFSGVVSNWWDSRANHQILIYRTSLSCLLAQTKCAFRILISNNLSPFYLLTLIPILS